MSALDSSDLRNNLLVELTHALEAVLGPDAPSPPPLTKAELDFMCLTLIENAKVLTLAVEDVVETINTLQDVAVGEMLLVLLACVRTTRRWYAAQGRDLPAFVAVRKDYWPLLNLRLLTASPAHPTTCARLVAVTLALGSDASVAAARARSREVNDAVAMLEAREVNGGAFLAAKLHKAEDNMFVELHSRNMWNVQPTRNAAIRLLFTDPAQHLRQCDAQLRRTHRLGQGAAAVNVAAFDSFLAPYVAVARQAPGIVGPPLLGCSGAADVLRMCRAPFDVQAQAVARVQAVPPSEAEEVMSRLHAAGAETLALTDLLNFRQAEMAAARRPLVMPRPDAAAFERAGCDTGAPLLPGGRPAALPVGHHPTPERRRRMSGLLQRAGVNSAVCAAVLGKSERAQTGMPSPAAGLLMHRLAPRAGTPGGEVDGYSKAHTEKVKACIAYFQSPAYMSSQRVSAFANLRAMKRQRQGRTRDAAAGQAEGEQ